MGTLTIRSLPEDVIQGVKTSAELHKRSLEHLITHNRSQPKWPNKFDPTVLDGKPGRESENKPPVVAAYSLHKPSKDIAHTQAEDIGSRVVVFNG